MMNTRLITSEFVQEIHHFHDGNVLVIHEKCLIVVSLSVWSVVIASNKDIVFNNSA